MRFFLFKLPKYKRFHFITRYYDPEKEERAQRYERILRAARPERDPEEIKESIRAFYRRRQASSAPPVKTRGLYIGAIAISTLGFLYIGLWAYLFAGIVIAADWWHRRSSNA
ncbi:MAG: hypothetical protein KatS3mg033_1294 [Thermonema sp.]|uniref:hypothetical protein n=1 Tax=Thermonema sp. TaxID=2231181 RepID=UPI0021DDF54E|nr:hypothetical protein [Thermonema sp.]GIV39494.1 MAG: hypothetical protein KatS3mg033_1294 [Thermonema sp.]